jgi:hypothetical protein
MAAVVVGPCVPIRKKMKFRGYFILGKKKERSGLKFPIRKQIKF